jgi:hypothetical protein
MEGKLYLDRREQFNHINNEAKKASKSGNSVVLSGFQEPKILRL